MKLGRCLLHARERLWPSHWQAVTDSQNHAKLGLESHRVRLHSKGVRDPVHMMPYRYQWAQVGDGGRLHAAATHRGTAQGEVHPAEVRVDRYRRLRIARCLPLRRSEGRRSAEGGYATMAQGAGAHARLCASDRGPNGPRQLHGARSHEAEDLNGRTGHVASTLARQLLRADCFAR